jgi:hypothetical protein
MPTTNFPICEDYFEEDNPQDKEFFLFVPAPLSPASPLEKLTELCPLLVAPHPCRYQEEVCQEQKNNYHLCVNYRRHIRERLLEECKKAEKKRQEKDEHGFYK